MPKYEAGIPFQAGVINKDKAILLLKEVGESLEQAGIYTTMDVYGGIAMALTITPLYSSDDIDTRMSGANHTKFRAITEAIGRKHGLRPDWINEDIVPIINSCLKTENLTNFEKFSGLTIRLPSAEQLLAMKVFAARLNEGRHDLEHAVALCKALNISGRMQIEDILKRFVVEDQIKRKNREKGRHNCIHNFITALIEELKK